RARWASATWASAAAPARTRCERSPRRLAGRRRRAATRRTCRGTPISARTRPSATSTRASASASPPRIARSPRSYRATSVVPLDDAPDDRVELVVRVTAQRAVPHPREEVELGTADEPRDLLSVLRRRLDVLVVGEDVERRRDLRQPVDDVEVDAGLPLRDQRLLVVLDEAHLRQPGLDPCPPLLVSEQPGGVELGRVVHDRESLLEPFPATPQLDLRPHVVAEPAPTAVCGTPGRDRAAEQVGAVEAELQRDERSHRLPEDRDGRLADRLDQPAGVAGHVGDRPRQRLGADGLADAAGGVGRVAEV